MSLRKQGLESEQGNEVQKMAVPGFRVKHGMTRGFYLSFQRKHVPAEAGTGIQTRQPLDSVSSTE